ncbi:MAG: HAMP domain-containing protein, partial [Pyrinomonadaceae bacterium]|nr:HAMP domain-containing protein [Pyrinomonadaceae bacterium]
MFWKIFLWFWLAMGFLTIAFTTVTFLTQTEPVLLQWQIIGGEAIRVQTVSAAEIFEREGEVGLQSFLCRIGENSKLKVIVYDEDFRQIASNGDLPNTRNLFEKAAKSDKSEFDLSYFSTMAAQKIVTKNGETLIVIMDLPEPRLAFFLVEPTTRLLRFSVTLLVTGIVCYGLAFYLTSPLEKLRRATRSFAKGDLSIRVAEQFKKRRRDEITDLATAFDEMATQIETLITSQKRLVSDVSHELRSPLARLGVALEIARTQSNAEVLPSLERIELESFRLNELISQLLLLAKLETNAAKVEKHNIELLDLIKDIVSDANFEATNQSKSIKLSTTENLVINCDKNLLRSAIENVIRNAIRHAPENSSVEVS